MRGGEGEDTTHTFMLREVKAPTTCRVKRRERFNSTQQRGKHKQAREEENSTMHTSNQLLLSLSLLFTSFPHPHPPHHHSLLSPECTPMSPPSQLILFNVIVSNTLVAAIFTLTLLVASCSAVSQCGNTGTSFSCSLCFLSSPLPLRLSPSITITPRSSPIFLPLAILLLSHCCPPLPTFPPGP